MADAVAFKKLIALLVHDRLPGLAFIVSQDGLLGAPVRAGEKLVPLPLVALIEVAATALVMMAWRDDERTEHHPVKAFHAFSPVAVDRAGLDKRVLVILARVQILVGADSPALHARLVKARCLAERDKVGIDDIARDGVPSDRSRRSSGKEGLVPDKEEHTCHKNDNGQQKFVVLRHDQAEESIVNESVLEQ